MLNSSLLSSQMNLLVLLLLQILILCELSVSVVGSSYGDSSPKLNFLNWGQKCRQPVGGEFLRPHELCNEGKGIFCQKFTQGDYCGCRIAPHQVLSYDKASGECRIMPQHHCFYDLYKNVNTSVNPEALKDYPYHVKCHRAADCVKLTSKGKREENVGSNQAGICQCRKEYLLSKDRLECVSQTGGAVSTTTPISNVLSISLTMISMTMMIRIGDNPL